MSCNYRLDTWASTIHWGSLTKESSGGLEGHGFENQEGHVCGWPQPEESKAAAEPHQGYVLNIYCWFWVGGYEVIVIYISTYGVLSTKATCEGIEARGAS